MEEWNPVVTVVIPCYNYGNYVEEAIDSCIKSTFPHIEIIVVDDGSTDPLTVKVLNELKKPKTRVIRQMNKGLPAARNRGISEASGKYILPLDADDKIEPTYIEEAVQVLEKNPRIGFVSCWFKYFGDQDKVKKMPPYNFYTQLFSNKVCVCSLIRKTAWEQAGGYNEAMTGYADWDFWISLGEKGWLGYTIPKVLFHYRKHGKTMFYRSLQKHDLLVKQIQKNHPKLYEEKSLESLKRQWGEGK